MARTLQILQITQSGSGIPGKITVAGNQTQVFQGKFYREDAPPHAVVPAYTSPAPTGFTLIAATTFDITGNLSYNGRYTVYTPVSLADLNPSSYFDGTNTEISVNEIIGVPLSPGDVLNTGLISNISTFVIRVADVGSSVLEVIVPPAVNNTDHSIEIVGRGGIPWGEAYTQNFVKVAQNFAGPTAPTGTLMVGQPWFDTTTNILKIWSGSTWTIANENVLGKSFRFAQASALQTWTINHNMNLAAPYVAMVQCFVDRPGPTTKMIIPQDISFVDANNLTVTFTNAETGIILINSGPQV